MLPNQLLSLVAVAVVPVLGALAHGHDQEPLNADADWAARHLAGIHSDVRITVRECLTDHPTEEHHISNFDAGAFFSLHDYDSSLAWTPDEIARTYGLNDESAKDVSDEKRREVIHDVLDRFDRDHDGYVTRTEFMDTWREGQRLKDFGLGPGHHGDDEYEYEIHHFEKYHDESKSPLSLLCLANRVALLRKMLEVCLMRGPLLQILARKTSPILKILLILRNMTPWRMRPIASRSLTGCP